MPDEAGTTTTPAIEVLALFDETPTLDPEGLCGVVTMLEQPQQPCEAGPVERMDGEPGQPAARVSMRVGEVETRLALFAEPLPEGVARRTIGVSYWPPAVKSALGWHGSYVSCSAGGEAAPMERAIAAYKVAMALVAQGASGVVSEQAWTCFPSSVFHTYQDDYVWPRLRDEGVPAEMVTGFLKTRVGDQLWFLSRGYSLFGLPDLAYAAQNHGEAESMRLLFHTLFAYMYAEDSIQPGQTMTLSGGMSLRVAAPTPEQTFLNSPTGTLVII